MAEFPPPSRAPAFEVSQMCVGCLALAGIDPTQAQVHLVGIETGQHPLRTDIIRIGICQGAREVSMRSVVTVPGDAAEAIRHANMRASRCREAGGPPEDGSCDAGFVML